MRKSKKVIAMATSALLAGGITGGIVTPSYAAGNNAPVSANVNSAEHSAAVKYSKINESQAVLSSDNFEFTANSEGIATVTDNVGNTEQLPTEALDVNGDRVFLKYSQLDNGDLLVSAVLAEQTGFRGAGKCITGVAGAAIGGATGGALAGASVGTVTLPVVGTVAGSAVGAIGGGVGGALTGAATNCFD